MPKNGHDVAAVEFRGQSFDIDLTAFRSLRVQTALALADRDPASANWAMDVVCCGHVVDYLGRIPDAGGEAPGELGCSPEDWQDFLSAVAEALQAKNS